MACGTVNVDEQRMKFVSADRQEKTMRELCAGLRSRGRPDTSGCSALQLAKADQGRGREEPAPFEQSGKNFCGD